MAMSADGIIASESGNEDFLSTENWKEFERLANKAGNFIWGRKTYQSVIQWPSRYFDKLNQLTKIVISSNTSFVSKKGFLPAVNPQDALELLEQAGFTECILTGGATNNASFAKLGLIDEVIINIEPALVGEGIRLFSDTVPHMKLNLLNISQVTDQIIQLHYKVK
jgi:dihydrofolate reductase